MATALSRPWDIHLPCNYQEHEADNQSYQPLHAMACLFVEQAIREFSDLVSKISLESRASALLESLSKLKRGKIQKARILT